MQSSVCATPSIEVLNVTQRCVSLLDSKCALGGMIEQVQEVHTDERMYRVGANALSARGFVAVPVMGKHGLLSKRADRAAKLEVAEDSTDDLCISLLFLTYRTTLGANNLKKERLFEMTQKKEVM